MTLNGWLWYETKTDATSTHGLLIKKWQPFLFNKGLWVCLQLPTQKSSALTSINNQLISVYSPNKHVRSRGYFCRPEPLYQRDFVQNHIHINECLCTWGLLLISMRLLRTEHKGVFAYIGKTWIGPAHTFKKKKKGRVQSFHVSVISHTRLHPGGLGKRVPLPYLLLANEQNCARHNAWLFFFRFEE